MRVSRLIQADLSDLRDLGLAGYTEKKGFAYIPDLPLKRKPRRSGASFAHYAQAASRVCLKEDRR